MKNKRSDQIFAQLREQLRGLAPESKLVPVREMMREFGVSQLVVTEALDRLEVLGAIRREHGKGIFVRGEAGQRRLLLLAVPLWASIRYTELEVAFGRVCAESGWRLKVLHYEMGPDWLNEVTAAAEGCDGLALEPFAGALTPEVVRKLLDIPQPLVLLDQDLARFGLSSVCAHHSHGGRLAAQAFLERGHRELAVLVAEPLLLSSRDRRDGFVEQVRLGGGEAAIIDCHTAPGEDAMERAYQTMLGLGAFEFTGLFVVSDGGAIGALKALYDRKVRVPEELSVIGFDGLDIGRFTQPALTTLCVDNRRIASQVLEEIGRICVNKTGHTVPPANGPRELFIPPQLLERESLCAANMGATRQVDSTPGKTAVRKNGFSLIELLVVVAIIAVLAALLMPALQKALAGTRITSCANNLKQFGQASYSYATDFNASFPPCIYPLAYDYAWDCHLAPYLGVASNGASSGRYGYKVPGNSASGYITTALLQCPGNQYASNSRQRGYTANSMLSGAPTDRRGVISATPRKYTQLARPSRTVEFFDYHNSNNLQFCTAFCCTTGWLGGDQSAMYYHGAGGMNFQFCDGHVQLLPPEMAYISNPKLWYY